MIRRLLIFVSIALGVAFPASINAAPARWVISDEDTTLLLFGSIHVMRPSTDWLDSGLREDVLRADGVFLESVQDPARAAELQAFVGANGVMQGTTLMERLGDEAYQKVAASFKSLGVPEAQISPMRPWLATVSLVFAKFQTLGYDPELGVDRVIERLAEERGIPVSGLEDPLTGLRLFAGLNPEDEDRFLIDTVKELASLDAFVDSLVAAWLAGDVETVAKISNQSIKDAPALMEPLLIGRNRAWASTITGLMDQPGLFVIVVGSAHLAGEGNLLEMLMEVGLTVTRVPGS